jgi:hypothetical protein
VVHLNELHPVRLGLRDRRLGPPRRRVRPDGAAVFVQMPGALVQAAGVPRVFEGGGSGVVTAGHLVMRVGLIPQWLRGARTDGKGRRRPNGSPEEWLSLKPAGSPC